MSGDPLRDHLRDLKPPWYAREQDTWQRIDAPPPPDAPWHWNLGWDGTGLSAATLAWILLAALAVAGAVVLLRLWRRREAADAALARPQAAAGATRLGALPAAPGPGDPERELAAACAAQDWPRAVVWLYVRALLRLDGAGVLRLAPGLGDHDCRRAVRAWAAAGAGRGPVADALDDLGACYLATRFGHQPCDGTRFAALAAADTRAADRLAAAAQEDGR